MNKELRDFLETKFSEGQKGIMNVFLLMMCSAAFKNDDNFDDFIYGNSKFSSEAKKQMSKLYYETPPFVKESFANISKGINYKNDLD